MKNSLKEYNIKLGESVESAFLNKIDIYQDGTVPMCRDENGKLWAISGHSHMGHIGMFCGDCVENLTEAHPISTDFSVGAAGKAFANIHYPEYVKSRGSVWPFGLYICPNTHRFFCFFHNETGWNGQGTAYDALGSCETPRYDSDFRHVGLMHSDDEGKTWFFDRWVLTGEKLCCTDRYIPEDQNLVGQHGDEVNLGSGDFSLFVEPDGEYMYIFYNVIKEDVKKGEWNGCDVYVARTRKRTDGVMGDFVKYYNGSFCEAGNLGRETVIAGSEWHPRVLYSRTLGEYVMASAAVMPNRTLAETIGDYLHLRTSKNLVDWSEPITVERDGKKFGNHYNAIVSGATTEQPNIADDEFLFLTCHNGTDVLLTKAKIEKK